MALDLLAGSAVAAAGMNVRVEFSLTRLDDGAVVDARDASDPLEFVAGEDLVFPGLDKAVQGMAVGEAKELSIQGEDAFGDRAEGHSMEVPQNQLPPGVKLGSKLQVQTPDGGEMWVTVAKIGGGTVTVDLNHPLAGVPLKLAVRLLSAEEAEELPPFEVETTRSGDEKTFPGKGEVVTVHYAGALADGTRFLSTWDKGEPLRFQLGVGAAIKGLDEAIPLMSLGERANIRVPAVMAYGEAGLDGVVPPNAELLFDLELLKIEPITAA